MAEVNEYKPRNTEIEETIKLFNKLRNSFSQENLKKLWEKFHKKERDSLTKKVEIEKFRRKFYGKEKVYNILKEKGNLTNKEEKIQRNIMKYFKDLKEELSKIKTYRYNTTHDIKHLFNEITKEDYYEPAEIKSAFDGNYIKCESIGDNDDNLSLEEYLNIIRSYLRGMIDNHKAHAGWKIQLIMRIIFFFSRNQQDSYDAYKR